MWTDSIIRKCEQASWLGNVNILHNSWMCIAVTITKDSQHCSKFVCSRHKHYITDSVSKPHNGLAGRLCLSLTGVSRWLTTEPGGAVRTIFGVRPLSAAREPSTTHGSRYTGCSKATVPRHGTCDPTDTDIQLDESYSSKSGPQRIFKWT